MGRSNTKHRGKGVPAVGEDEDDEPRSLGAQSTNVGMMPPSDSDSESSGSDEKPKPLKQNANAGMMPPSDSDSDEEEKPKGKAKAAQPQQLTRKEREAIQGKVCA